MTSPACGSPGDKRRAPSLAEPAKLKGPRKIDCPFSDDDAGLDDAVVVLVVIVDVTGKPLKAAIVSSPGGGFGRAARACILEREYQPGLDAPGAQAEKTTPPIRVRFAR